MAESPVKIELYNEQGKLIYEKNEKATLGNNELIIEHDELQYIGVYFVYITIQGNRVMQKLLIEE
jgi:hypothetical protein